MSDWKFGKQWDTTAEDRKNTAGLVEKIVVDKTEPILSRLLAAKVHAVLVSGDKEN